MHLLPMHQAKKQYKQPLSSRNRLQRVVGPSILTLCLTGERANHRFASTASKFVIQRCFIPHLILLDRELHETKPEYFPPGIKWSYEQTTRTSSLRKHIKNVHLELYKQLCAEQKIKPLDTVVRKQTAEEALTPTIVRESFNKDTLLRYIRNFVIADDQVSLTSTSKSFNLTLSSLLMFSNAQSSAICPSSYERISLMTIYMDVTN